MARPVFSCACISILLLGALGRDDQCSAPLTAPLCIRGGGDLTLQKFDSSSAASKSQSDCCHKCSAHQGCKAWQLIEKNPSKGQECWLMATAAQKSGGNCTSAAIAPPVPPERLNRTQYSGVWVQHGSLGDLVQKGFLVGGDIALRWADLETSDGKWDWSAADAAIKQAVAEGFFVETALLVGPASPSWLFSAGVPKVEVTPAEGHSGQAQYFPYYLDQHYQHYFLRALDTFADHLASFPSHIKKRIVAAQAMYGSTGDDCPWHGTPKQSKFEISDDQWHNFTMSTAPAVCQSYTKRDFHVLWNTKVERLQQLVAECPGSFIKAGMVSHGFQVNYEADNYEGKGKICHAQGYHCRGESWPFMTHGYFDEAPVWATYWHLLWQLTFGVDMPGLSEPSLVNTTYEPFYRLFNKYAASVRPPATLETWPGAIIGLRDGLDSNDTDRFPESKYGAATRGNKDRMLAIAKAFSSRGAALGDPEAATSAAMKSRRRDHMNDVGWRIWRGNYGNGLITQLDPASTSIGWWRVGPHDQPYGRFARGLQQSTGKTSMGFILNQKLWGGLPLVKSFPLTIRVTYLDEGPGSFDIEYDGSRGCTTAQTVNVGTTARWVQTIIQLKDAHFAESCGWGKDRSGADLVLRAARGDIVFHGIEIYSDSAASELHPAGIIV